MRDFYMNNLPRVTFGFVNCNRLFYLRSCIESFLKCSETYENKELIIVDNASIESGTPEYLDTLEARGHTVIRQKERDPPNEFARAKNLIVEKATGDYICPVTGDLQFILSSGWLEEFVKFYSLFPDHVGCISLDAQRTIRNRNNWQGRYSDLLGESNYKFVFDSHRPPVAAATNALFSRANIMLMHPWKENNKNFEGEQDSETAMTLKVQEIVKERELPWKQVLPILPPCAGIFTDARGTNARVRGNRRYGDYWAPKDAENYRYYEIRDFTEMVSQYSTDPIPLGLEVMVKTYGGWKPPVDSSGAWLKNPIRVETAAPSDYVDLINVINLGQAEPELQEPEKVEDPNYLQEWLED